MKECLACLVLLLLQWNAGKLKLSLNQLVQVLVVMLPLQHKVKAADLD